MPSSLRVERYLDQRARWPSTGRHILAQFDDQSIVVYQAYAPEIGHPAAQHGRFVAPWSRSRMSWIKPNFLWMMYRSGWGTKPGQEVVLAIRLLRRGFDECLAAAVPSSFDPACGADHARWAQAIKQSDVRLQWDPDHDPKGLKQERRALQLGLRGPTLSRYADEWILSIEDISDFVNVQREILQSGQIESLCTPYETVYGPQMTSG
ncbi:DUF4291 domain-containing protein [Haliangium sp. UPWRP_2]|uniref:DUF4291 domain-containing protein n=1 Tax=Haliangium sp. UPWRP_2 TaxID=1931276 RepID=UPI000D0CD24C|nr:DUF4291 domain-containing protein [Haliangium sp. UPWRP_2]PSM31557.1 DUF4291 domain-containing protein [Haliangium sp. UPWRP_2]